MAGRLSAGIAGALSSSTRLGAIDYLFEAEDESQQWPDVHAAIRASRKACQADGTMPDWAALEALIGDMRRAE